MPISSAISSEMYGLALLLHQVDQLVHGLLHADVHAPGGAIQDQHLAARAQPLAEHYLLLVAAGHGRHRLFHVAALDGQRVHLLLHIGGLVFPEEQPALLNML